MDNSGLRPWADWLILTEHHCYVIILAFFTWSLALQGSGFSSNLLKHEQWGEWPPPTIYQNIWLCPSERWSQIYFKTFRTLTRYYLATSCFKPTFLRRFTEEYQHYPFFTDYLKVGDIILETHFVLTKGKQSLIQQQSKLWRKNGVGLNRLWHGTLHWSLTYTHLNLLHIIYPHHSPSSMRCHGRGRQGEPWGLLAFKTPGREWQLVLRITLGISTRAMVSGLNWWCYVSRMSFTDMLAATV